MKRSDNFRKFEKKPKGSAIKEQIKQDKKKAKKERAEAIEKHFAKKREERALQRGSTSPRETFRKKEGNIKSAAPEKQGRKFEAPPKKQGRKFEAPPKKQGRKFEAPPKKQGRKFEGSSKKRGRKFEAAPKTHVRNSEAAPKTYSHKSEAAPRTNAAKSEAPFKKIKHTNKFEKVNDQEPAVAKHALEKKQAPAKGFKASQSEKAVSKLAETSTEQMPLNKYIAHSGICSRRDAAILVKDKKVTVNGDVATDPGTKVTSTDVIKVSGQKITPSKNFVYILLNKPKDFITTLDDPQGRRTVLDLVRQATAERIYPIGRLDRNTSGVLLLTNDGELAQKLSHPKHEIKKVYEVKLDRNLTKGDMDKIAEGITLEDGFIAPDVIAYADAKDKSVIGIEIHSGRNRIVRRIFEHMKYDVRGLDRVMYAGLTKKNVLRGKWRFLTEKEVRLLKFMNMSYVKSKSE